MDIRLRLLYTYVDLDLENVGFCLEWVKCEIYTALQSQKAVSAYLLSK